MSCDAVNVPVLRISILICVFARAHHHYECHRYRDADVSILARAFARAQPDAVLAEQIGGGVSILVRAVCRRLPNPSFNPRHIPRLESL